MRLIAIYIVILVTAVGCYDSHTTPLPKEHIHSENCNIEKLRQICGKGYHTISTEMICTGVVTSSDNEGNFYRSIVVEDLTGGIEVLLGTYNTAAQYPIGLEVDIVLNGTAIMVENGVLTVGLPPLGHDLRPREFGSQAVIDNHIIRSNSVKEIEPLSCDIPSLAPSLCGRFIRIDDLVHTPYEEFDEGDYRRLTDGNSNEVFVYISSYAEFADIDISGSKLSVQGVLYYETINAEIGDQYTIKPRSKDDFSTTGTAF